MSNNKHLTLKDRSTIEFMLCDKASFVKIASALDKDPTTISKEIRSHLVFKRIGGHYVTYNACIHRTDCLLNNVCKICHSSRKYKLCRRCVMCNRFCPHFQQDICSRLLHPPYVCNGCSKRLECSLEKRIYEARSAHFEYRKILSESRSGLSLSEQDIRYIDGIVSPLLKQKQSPHHVCIHNSDSLMISERTLYRLIDSGLLSARNIDLPRKVRFSARKRPAVLKIDRSCRIGRDFAAFSSFMEEHPDIPVVQLDSVEGKKGGKVLLTIHFQKSEMMLAFLRDHNDSLSVIHIFDSLYRILGPEFFSTLFQVCLTDNGPEFSNPAAIEYDSLGTRRTRIFYCDPSAPYQKGSAERNHEFIRCFFQKGMDFSSYDQNDIQLMMDHINSYSRKSLGDKSPYEMFAFLYGEETLELLGCRILQHKDVTLNSSIFHKEVADHEI